MAIIETQIYIIAQPYQRALLRVGGHYATLDGGFAKTMSIEGGAGKAELDWEELESLDTHAASHCTALDINHKRIGNCSRELNAPIHFLAGRQCFKM